MAASGGSGVRVEGIEELRRKLKALGDKAERRVTRAAIRKAGNVILKNARKRAPKERGKLRAGLAIKASVTNHGESARIGAKLRAGARHAHLVEKGTRPHEVKARRSRSLMVGQTALGKRVRHPGAAARPFLQPAFDESQGEAKALFKAELKKHIASIAG